MAAVDMYCHMDGVEGESTDKAFAKEMEIYSFSHNMLQTAAKTASTAGGGTSGRINFEDFTIVKPVDKATPTLFKFCASGQHINNIWIKLRRAGGEQHVYAEYHFTNCVLTQVTSSADGHREDSLPCETVRFNYDSMKVVYNQQAREGGGIAGSSEGAWSLKENALM